MGVILSEINLTNALDRIECLAAGVGWGLAQQTRLTALLHSSGELKLVRGLEQDAPWRFRWNFASFVWGECQPVQLGMSTAKVSGSRESPES